MRPLKFRIWDGNNKHFVYPDILELNAGLEYQQFTGLLDKQGKEIYEGDVVQDSHGYKARIEYSDGAFILIIEGRFPDTDMAGEGNNKFYEVIGNVWENPELLKG